MSNTNDKQPPLGKDSSNKNDAPKDAAENKSMFDSIKQYFSGKSGEAPAPSDSPVEKAVDENGQVVNGANAETNNAETNKELQGAPNNNGEPEEAAKKPEEEGKPKELTLEDIEKLQAAAAGEAQESGFSVPKTIQHNNRGEVDSLPRDLGLNPFPPLEQKILPTVLSEQQPKVDHPVEILDLTPKLLGGDAVVNENDLLANRGPNESEGSDPVKESTTVAGDFKLVAPDGVDDLTVGGNNVITNGVFAPIAFVTPLGNVLSITGYNPATGVVTYEYTLVDNEQHPNGNGTNSIFEDFDVHLSDTDGDTADGTLSINIVDDIPSIEVSESLTPYLIVDETSLNVDATGSFAGLFSSVPGADGATIVYNIHVSSDGADSGLVDTESQIPVLLFQDGNDIVGRAGNEEVFRISINPNTGDVTLDQVRAVVHADPNNPDDSAALLSNSLVKITATITDGDGDVDTATKDIGNAFVFKDDAPTGTITIKPGVFIATDESAGQQGPDTALPPGTLGQTTVLYANLLNDNTSYGADGAGTKVFTLNVVDGVASGFKTPDGSQDIVLVNNGGVVEGHVGDVNGALAFTISADANGITLTQYLAVQHSPDTGPDQLSGGMNAGVLTLIETVTDKDGDHISPAVDLGSAIRFYDDAPSGIISLKPGVLLATDETAGIQGPDSALPPGSLGQATILYANLINDGTIFGSDGPGTKTFALNVVDGSASGFKTPDGSQDIVLLNNNGVIEGHVGNVNGLLAFTISVNNGGDVTLTQYLAVQHSPDTGPNQLSGSMNPGALSYVVTVTDADGDHISPAVDLGSIIKFFDDAPSGNIAINDGAFIATDETAGKQGPDTSVPPGTLGQTVVSYANLLVDNTSFGSDGAGTKTYSLSVVDGTASGFKTPDGSQDIVLVNNGGVIEGHVGNVNGAVAFTISADANGITLTQYLAVQHSPDTGPNQLSNGMNAGVLTLIEKVTDADGDFINAPVDLGPAIKFYDDAPSGHIRFKEGAIIATDESAGQQGPDTSVPPNTLGQTSVLYSNLLVDATSFGSDGPGTKTYSLSVVDGSASGFKTPDGTQDIVLLNNNGVIEGHVGNVNGALVFTINTDANGITLTQYLAVQHSPDTGPNQLSNGMNAGVLTLVEKVTDADGDFINAQADLGSVIKFYDDAPTGTISLKPGALIATDESAGQQGPDTSVPPGTLGQNFVSYANLLVDNTSFGSDGAGTKSYSLNVVNGAASGFKTPDGSQDIVLFNNNGVIEGHVGNVNGVLAFTVSADANGITLTQYLAVQHSPDTGPNQLSNGMNAGALTLTEKVTDADGDFVNAPVDLGVAIKFYDDAPIGSISLKPGALIATDESAGKQGPDTSVPPGTLGQTIVSYANLLVDNTSFGSDGAGTKTYSLNVIDGTASGFKTPDGSQDIVLKLNGGVVEGHVGNVNGALVFTISADANGITLTQYLAVQHSPDTGPNQLSSGMNSGVLTLIEKVTDADGDFVNAPVDLGPAVKFYDDAPSGTISLKTGALVATDESAGQQGPDTALPPGTLGQTSVLYSSILFDNTSFGSDGAGTKTYSLSVVDGTASGFKTPNGAQDIVLVNNGGVVEGHVGNVNGALAFTISASPTGITLTQYLAVQHTPDSGPNQLSNGMNPGVLTLIEKVTDADGDFINAPVDLGSVIKFYDDGPHIEVNQNAAPVLVVDESNFLIDSSTSFAGLFTSSFGSDGPKDVDQNNVADNDAITYQLSILAPGANSGLVDTESNQAVVLSLEGGVVVGRAGLGGNVVFTISVDANSGVVTLNQSRAVVHADQNDPNDATMLSADNLVKLTATIRDGDLDSASATKNIGQSFKFQDDGPIAVKDGCFDVPLPVQPKYNLTFVLDISGSMDSVVSGSKTRLDILKEALTNPGALLDSYQAASSDLRITIVTFSAGAQTSIEFSDVAAAKAFIAGLDASGTTNYLAAANAATADVNADDANAALVGFTDRLYWLSDGEPNPTSTALTDAQELAWRNNLIQGNVEAYMLNIGGSNANIVENLADLDDDQPGTVITVAADLSNLQQILIDTINQSEVQGNVLANDIAGADQNPAVVNVYFFLADNAAANAYIAAHPELVGATASGNKVTIPVPNADITTPLGNILHIEADGDFTYTTVQNNNPNQGDHDDMFYTMRDGDGDRASAEICFDIDLGVTITNLTPKAQGGDVTVDEDDLLATRGANESAGSDTTKESTTQPGTFNISAPNGVDDLSVGGHAVITNGVFAAVSFTTPLGNTLSITGYNAGTGEITYSYTLNDNEQHPNANGENSLFEDFNVVLSDIDGDSANAILSARVIDDVPNAIDDANGVASENNLVLVGNVRTNDIQGADGANVTPVNLVGTYGSVVINADGSYVYTLNPNDADFKALGGGGVGVENFNYSLVDADGDSDIAKLVISVKNDDDTVLITDLTPKAQGGDVSVDEDDLLANRGPNESAGSDPSKESTTQPGNFKISAPDGVDDLTVGGQIVINNGVFAPISFNTPLGNTLAITGYNPATGVITYTYTLNDNEAHPNANGENTIFEDFVVTLRDVDGDVANDTLSARIVDDVPDAIDDVNGVASESNLQLIGNVRTNDIQGADGANVTPVNLVGTYGSVVINADGSYVYTLNVNDADFKALGGGGVGVENFNYTLTDADGDSDVAKLTLNIKNDDNTVLITDLTPKAQGGDVTVDEDDLLASRGPGESAGSDPTKESTTQPGNFKISAPDGVDDVSVGGHAVITNGVFAATSFTTPLGNTLSITGYNPGTGVITYEYTLNDNEQHPNANGENAIFEDFAVTLTDVDGDSANDTLSARIIDDVPTAVEDCFTIPIPVQPKYNLTFVLDISGSMDSIISGSKTRLDILKEALTNSGALLDSYQAASSELKITIVTFSSGAQTSAEFSDVAAAKAFINGLDANGTTNYLAAANAATADVNADDANAALVGFTDRLYWLSDGEPNPTSTALTDAQELAWRNNLAQGNVEAFMLNIGGTNANLNENLADLDDDQPGVVITVAPDLSNLQQILVDTINQTEVLGNVLTNDIQGADDNATVINIYFNLASAQAANAYLAAHPELVGATVNGAVVTIPVPNADITTPLGNILHIEADGDFKYTSNVSNGGNGDEDILFYTMKDNDGDQSSAEFCFDIDFGVTITNLTPKAQGGDVTVNEDDLLASRGANESAGSDTSKESTTQAGNFNISAPNGVDDVSIGGHAIITNGVFAAVSFSTPLGNTLSITAYNAATGLISYQYTLNDNEAHPNANGKNVLFEDFQVTVSDTDGDSANATLSVGIIDDVPDAINDTNASTASESTLVLTGNVRTNDIQGADGASVTPVNLSGTYGSIVIDANGNYTYTLNINDADFKALKGGGTGVENFNYTLTDTDGDADTAVLSLNIRNNNDGVLITDLTAKAQGGDASVNENDLLASRGAGESAGSDPTKESTTTTGDFKISAPDGIATLTIGGKDVIVNDVFTAASITSPLGNTLNITGYNAATGVVSYSYTLNDNENHPTANGTNSLFEDFAVSLKDRDGDSASNTLSINIIDDVPTAVADVESIIKPALPAYNLVFDLDVSGSMGDVIANTGGKTRLQILKEALTGSGALLDSYAAASSALHITFVTFSSNAQTSQAFTDVAAAKAFVNGLSANGSTNYIAAMSNAQTVMNADKANASLANYIDKTYFISDGQPNVGTPTSGNYQTWQTNIANNSVDAIIINIAPPANQANINQYLTPLANPGDNPAVYAVNADLSNLQGILVGTINDLAHINGNVLTNDVQGADGHLVVTQIQFSFASSQAATAYFNAHPELIGKSINGSTVTIPVPQNSDIATPLGEKLHIETDGDFTYTIDANAVTGKTDTFTYTAVDTDGDPTSAQVQISIESPQAAKMAITSLAVTSTAADTHDSVANSDVAFATTKAPYVDNMMDNDVIGDKGAKVVQISFETDDAAKYIKDNHLDVLNATVDKDGKTVHIPLPGDGSEIEFATPHGGSLAANNSGEYAYTVKTGSEDLVEHFKYTLQDQATGNLHDANLDVNVFKHPDSLVNLMGSDANDIMSSANHNAEAIMMEGGKGINDFIIDVGDTNAPETIFIKDLGINKQNVLSFVNVEDANHDGKVSFMDAVESFHQDGPNANLEITLQNKTTLVLENVGTVPGHDMQALQQHLESITAELHVVK